MNTGDTYLLHSCHRVSNRKSGLKPLRRAAYTLLDHSLRDCHFPFVLGGDYKQVHCGASNQELIELYDQLSDYLSSSSVQSMLHRLRPTMCDKCGNTLKLRLTTFLSEIAVEGICLCFCSGCHEENICNYWPAMFIRIHLQGRMPTT